jgi:NAD+ synthase (glutamine-hydrolysing)
MIRHGFKPEKILFLADIAFSGIYETGLIAKTLKEFVRRFFTNQFKRNVVPDGIKIGTVALSPRADWRMPSEADYLSWITNIANPAT